MAFKGFTHTSASGEVWDDAADGRLTIAGKEYPLSDEMWQVLGDPANRPFWNAGAIGPDGFPDLIVGQSHIHPYDPEAGVVGTGKWLRHVLTKAREALGDSRYDHREKSQILAFAYGYLSHAIGDVWGHTVVNEFAQGVFPAYDEAVAEATAGDVDKFAIIARHLLSEGYITDATPGFDGTKGPDQFRWYDGFYTDDTTPAVPFDVPTRWVYDAMLATRPAGAQPSFVMEGFDEFRDALWSVRQFCIGEVIAGHCVGVGRLGTLLPIDDWIGAVDRAKQDWPLFALAITQGLFDPETRREAQDDECSGVGTSETSPARVACEAGVSTVDAALHKADWYLTYRLKPALLSPTLSTVLDILDDYASWVVDKVLDPALRELGISSIREALRDVEAWLEDAALDLLADALGFDFRDFGALLDSPSSKMDLTQDMITIEGQDVGIPLFEPGDHVKLDTYLGLPDSHLGPLADEEFFDKANFAAYKNTVTMTKLALLNGATLDQVLTDLSGGKKSYSLYATAPSPSNIMTTVLPGANSDQPLQWLLSIDGDHAWRDGTQNVFGPYDASGSPWTGAGAGNFPLYESCVLRPVFPVLFTDWEQDTAEAVRAQQLGESGPVAPFAALGDPPSADPNDPEVPRVTMTPEGAHHVQDPTIYFGTTGRLSMTAIDDYWHDEHVTVGIRWYPTGSDAPEFTGHPSAATLTPPDIDGEYVLDVRASDPCGTGTVSLPIAVDTTPPEITITEPVGVYDTDDTASIDYAITDGPLGSGVASSGVTFDDDPAALDDQLDIYALMPGEHRVVVTATDNVGNATSSVGVFEVQATAVSLANNVTRASEEGLISDQAVHGLIHILDAAARSHDRGMHATEANQIGAFIKVLQARHGKAVDADLADRLIAHAQYLIQIETELTHSSSEDHRPWTPMGSRRQSERPHAP